MARSLIVSILGDAKQFGAELDKAAGKTKQFGKVAGVAGLAIAGGLAYGLEKSVKAAEDAQQSTARLDQAFKVVGLSAQASAGAIDMAEASGRKLGFTDDDVRTSLGSLITATGNVKASMTDLGVAQDLARFKGIDLADASKMMTMAMTGSQRAAKQLGITVIPVTANLDKLKASHVDLTTASGHLLEAHAKLLDKMATGQAVIDATSAKVHGQGQAFADTAAGGMAQMHAQLGHLEETVGQAVIPALTKLTAVLAEGAQFLAAHTNVAKLAIGVLGGLAAVLLTVSVASKVVAASEAIMTAAQWLLNAALTANPIGLVVVGLAALAAGLVLAWKYSATFRDIVRDTWEVIKKAAEIYILPARLEIMALIEAFHLAIDALHALEGAAGSAFSAISKVTSAASAVGGAVSSVAHAAGGLIPHFAAGGVVPGAIGAPMLAVVHGGETVTPPGVNVGATVADVRIYWDGNEVYRQLQRLAARDTLRGGSGLPG